MNTADKIAADKQSAFDIPHPDHVVSLKPYSALTPTDKKIHQQINMALQPHCCQFGVAVGPMLQSYAEHIKVNNLMALLDMANIQSAGKTHWLSDYMVPTPRFALLMALGAYLGVHYQIRPSELQQAASELLELFPDAEQDLDSAFNFKKASLAITVGLTVSQLLQELVTLKARYQQEASAWVLNNLLTIQTLLSDRMIDRKTERPFIAPQSHPNLQATAMVLMGAAGSGKSSVLAGLDVNQADCIVICTDAWRCFAILPPIGDGVDDAEGEQGESVKHCVNGFVRTQDAAYLFKEYFLAELVRVRRIELKDKPCSDEAIAQGANLLIDCILTNDFSDLFSTLNRQAIKTDYYMVCRRDLMSILVANYKRAENPKALIADKERHVQTLQAIRQHARMSRELLNACPQGKQVQLIDSDLAYHLPPEASLADTVCATVSRGAMPAGRETVIDIIHLDIFAEYLLKAHANPEAHREGELYHAKGRYGFRFKPIFAAAELLALIAHEEVCVATVQANKQAYCQVSYQEDGTFALEIIDQMAFMENFAESLMLQALITAIAGHNKQCLAARSSHTPEKLKMMAAENGRVYLDHALIISQHGKAAAAIAYQMLTKPEATQCQPGKAVESFCHMRKRGKDIRQRVQLVKAEKMGRKRNANSHIKHIV